MLQSSKAIWQPIVLAQTTSARSKLDYEIIVVDDNSPDGTQAVVNKLQHLYGQKRIVCLLDGTQLTAQIQC